MNQMSVATFDTLAAVRNLEKAGMGTSQAEAVTETIRVAVFQGVASKEDIGELRAELKADIGELRAATQADIAELRVEIEKVRTDLTWRMVGAMAGLLAIFTALDRFFLN